MKRKNIIYLTSFFTITVVNVFNKITSVSCSHIDVFNGDSVFLMLKFFGNVILGALIWIIGYQISRKLTLEKNKLIIYFISISLFSTSLTIKEIWKSNFSSYKELIKSICDKSSDDGMEYQANKMTANEYNYLVEDSGWLPKSPQNAKNIEIRYYRDEFLGDYSLDVEIEIPYGEKWDSLKYPKWEKVKENRYRYGGYQD